MTTFFELQNQIADARFRKAVLLHLIEHVDSNFRSVAGAQPLKVLLTDEKVTVPPQVFEAIVTDVLLAEAQALDNDINTILNAAMGSTVVEAQPQPAPPPPEQQPTPQVFAPVVQQPFQITVPPAPPPILPEPEAQATEPETTRRRRSAS
jgi:hypothetical protein